MPKADILSAVPFIQSLRQLITEKKRWRVSLAALNYRVHELKLTSDWKYRGFCIEIIKTGYDKNEPDEAGREKSVVWDKALKMLWSEKIIPADIASDLHLPVSELSDLLCGVLNAPVPSNPTETRLYSIVFGQDGETPTAV